MDTTEPERKLFKSASGYTFAFGMIVGKRCDHAISWDDPTTGSFMAKPDNDAGFIISPVLIGPNPKIIERDGVIRINDAVELRHCGKPFVWGIRLVEPAR